MKAVSGKSPKPVSRFSWVVMTIVVVLLSWAGIVSALRANRKLTGLAKLKGPLQSVRVGYQVSRGRNYYVAFIIKNSVARPALAVDSWAKAQQIQSQCRVGEEMTIYYDAYGPRIGTADLNFHVYQAESEGRIIYSLTQAHQKDNNWAWYFAVLALMCLSLMAWAYAQGRRQSQAII